MNPVADKILGRGVYSIAEAARLTRLRPRRASEWFRGRSSPSKIFVPVFDSDFPVVHEEYSISFLDLIELKIGGTLRDRGVSLPYLRKAYAQLRGEYGNHPFCRRAIFVGGKQIFTRGLSDSEGREVIEALTRQSYFESVILPFLEQVVYDPESGMAVRWKIADLVVIDPQVRFGKPTVEETGIATSVLSRSYYANAENADAVASWYAVEARHVRAAVEFENGLAA